MSSFLLTNLHFGCPGRVPGSRWAGEPALPPHPEAGPYEELPKNLSLLKFDTGQMEVTDLRLRRGDRTRPASKQRWP